MYSKKGVFCIECIQMYSKKCLATKYRMFTKCIEKKHVLKLYFKENLETEKKIIFQGKINSRRKYYMTLL